jgi:hypothetical protein
MHLLIDSAVRWISTLGDDVRFDRRRRFLGVLLAVGFFSAAIPARASVINAASAALADVTAAINSAANGDTVSIPAGSTTWTSGVSVSKNIQIVGAGSGRIVAYDDGKEMLKIAGGTLNVNIGGFSPGFDGSFFSAGQTLRIFETNSRSNWMQGTVTSYSGNVLTMNITSTGGSGSTHRWLISTIPTTTIVASNNTVPLFAISESSAGHVDLSGINFASSARGAAYITVAGTTGGQAVLIHDCWFQLVQDSFESIDVNVNRGVVWNCSFDGSSGNLARLITVGGIRIKDSTGLNTANSWSSASTWGAADTTGQHNFYVETNDFHAFQAACDNDDNGRMVWRYNLMDHATFATHGADTSWYGERYFEYYNNTGVFFGYSDGTTFNMANGWIGLVRGGTFVVHDNTLPLLDSQDYPHKADVLMMVMNLQRRAGPDGCWGQGTSNGADYPAPRQVGLGYVTGTGRDGLGRTKDSITYVGDSEPAYMWANSRQPLDHVGVADDGGTSCTNPDHSSDYLKGGRDFFNGSASKPNYTPYAYPHPLTVIGPRPAAPRNLRVSH